MRSGAIMIVAILFGILGIAFLVYLIGLAAMYYAHIQKENKERHASSSHATPTITIQLTNEQVRTLISGLKDPETPDETNHDCRVVGEVADA